MKINEPLPSFGLLYSAGELLRRVPPSLSRSFFIFHFFSSCEGLHRVSNWETGFIIGGSEEILLWPQVSGARAARLLQNPESHNFADQRLHVLSTQGL